MKQMIQALLGPQWAVWKSTLAQRLQIDEEKAGFLLGGAAQQVMGLFTQGRLNLQTLQTAQGVAQLLGELDVQSLAQQAGLDSAKLEGVLGEVLPDLVQKASALLGGTNLGDLLGNLGKNQ